MRGKEEEIGGEVLAYPGQMCALGDGGLIGFRIGQGRVGKEVCLDAVVPVTCEEAHPSLHIHASEQRCAVLCLCQEWRR